MICAFAPCVLGKFLHLLGLHPEAYQSNAQELAEKGESRNKRRSTIPTITPVTPAPPTPALPAYPPPFQFPFKNFRGIGESYAHPDRNDLMQYPIYRLPDLWGKTRRADRKWMTTSMPMSAAYRSTEDKKVITEATTSEPEGIQHIAKSATNAVEKDVVVTPAYKAVELPVQSASAPTPIPFAYTSAPSYEPRTASTFVYPPARSSSETLGTVCNSLHSTIEKHASQAPALQTAMRTFLHAADANTEYMSSASEIWGLMASAENDLKLYCKDGMTVEQSSCLGWNISIIEFWNYLVPAGLYIYKYRSQELKTFLGLYRGFANYLGLKDMIQHLDCTASQPSPSTLQYAVQPSQMPYHPPQVAQMPSWSAPQQNSASTISNLLLAYQPKLKRHLPQPPPSNTQVPLPSKIETQSVPSTISATIQAPSNHVAQTLQTTSTTSAPTQQRSVQQPQVTQGAPGLLKFNDDAWLKMSDRRLKALKWGSFIWRDDAEASLKVWSYDVPELRQLSWEHPEAITAEHVRAKLEEAAPHFKRAAVVLRLQGRGCPWPDRDDLGMVPLMGSILDCLSKAAEMTNKPEEIVVWDSRDKWRQACLYFHENIMKRDNIWEWLGHCYPALDKTRPLKKLWEEMKQEWLPGIG